MRIYLHSAYVRVFSVHKVDSKPSAQAHSSQTTDAPSVSESDSNLETSRFASETLESERESLNAYKQATANAKSAPQIVIDPPGIQGHGDADTIRTEEEQSTCTVHKSTCACSMAFSFLYQHCIKHTNP